MSRFPKASYLTWSGWSLQPATINFWGSVGSRCSGRRRGSQSQLFCRWAAFSSIYVHCDRPGHHPTPSISEAYTCASHKRPDPSSTSSHTPPQCFLPTTSTTLLYQPPLMRNVLHPFSYHLSLTCILRRISLSPGSYVCFAQAYLADCFRWSTFRSSWPAERRLNLKSNMHCNYGELNAHPDSKRVDFTPVFLI